MPRSGSPPSGGTAPSDGQARIAPVTVIVGEEELLVERAVRDVVAGREATPDVHDVRAADLKPGDLSSLTAPSLFGGGGLVVVRSVQDAGKEVAAELARY